MSIIVAIDDIAPSEMRRISLWLRHRNPLAPVRLVWCTCDDRVQVRLERRKLVGALLLTTTERMASA